MSQTAFQNPKKLPQILQSVAAESGPVALGIALACYGRICHLSELSVACGVTRDGTSPSKLLHAANQFGLIGEWETINIKELELLDHKPTICVGDNCSYFVILNIDKTTVEIYDSQIGRIKKSLDQINTTQILSLSKSKDFYVSESSPYWLSCLKLVLPLQWEFVALVLLATGSVIPILMIAACSSQFIDQFLEQKRLSFGVPIVWIALLALALKSSMSVISDVLLRRMSYVLERKMADDIYETLFSRSSSFLDLRNGGDIASRLMYPYYVPGTAFFEFLDPALELWTSTFIVLFSAFISFPLFFFLFLGYVAILISSYRLTLTTANDLTILQKSNSQRYSTAFQIINNLESLKAGAMEFALLEKWHLNFAQTIEENQIIGKKKVIRDVSINGSIFVTQVLLLGIGGLFIIQGSVSLGSLLAFLFIQDQIADSLHSIPSISNGWQSLQGKLLWYDDIKQAEPDPWHKPFQRSRLLEPVNLEDSFNIELKHVVFRFSPLNDPFLNDINCVIKSGQQILIRGGDGCGKTIFMQLLSGLRHPSGGSQLLNGQPLEKVDSRFWHQNVLYIGEKIPLYQGSILDNITLWRDGCTPENAIQAASVVGLSGWIDLFEHGIEHHLSNPNQILCNSQKIQLGIARILCGQPRVMLMDLNTAELRSEDEKRIFSFCREKGITLISLSERIADENLYDQILCLQRGSLV